MINITINVSIVISRILRFLNYYNKRFYWVRPFPLSLFFFFSYFPFFPYVIMGFGFLSYHYSHYITLSHFYPLSHWVLVLCCYSLFIFMCYYYSYFTSVALTVPGCLLSSFGFIIHVPFLLFLMILRYAGVCFLIHFCFHHFCCVSLGF